MYINTYIYTFRKSRWAAVYIRICMYKHAYIGSVSIDFFPRFSSQVWVSDVTFVTFFVDTKCDALHLKHFWKECDALAHENTFLNL